MIGFVHVIGRIEPRPDGIDGAAGPRVANIVKIIPVAPEIRQFF